MSVRAGIVVTGTEVLSGRTTDRNGPWVAERLGALGVEVAHITCVGDRPGDLLDALRFVEGAGAELVVTTGGLGPTADDLTAAVVAEFSGRDLELDTDMEAKIGAILARFAKRFKFDPEGVKAGNRKQAMVPKGAVALDPAGTAPGLVVPAASSTVIVLPGPPRELQQMWPDAIASEAVRELLSRAETFGTGAMRMFGVPESTIAKSLREIGEGVDLEPLEITTCLRGASELEIDVRYREGDRAALDGLFAGLRERHGDYIYSERGETIDELVAGLLGGHRLGLAESCTGGMLAARLTERPGASDYLVGGVVSYSNEAKSELLGVPAELIKEHGAVSTEVASAMAAGAIERFEADVAVSITGVAGPDGGTDEKPVGYVCFCVRDADGRKLVRDPTLPGSRGDIRARSVGVAMHMLRRFLLGQDLPV